MPDIATLNIKRILIIDLAFIGDLVLATPVTRAIRQRWPEAHIAMLTVPLTKSVAAMNPYIDEVVPYDKGGAHKGLKGMWQISRQLKSRNFDLAICMNFALRGAVVAWLAGIPYRLGYDAQHAGWFLTWAADHHRDGIKHETENHLEVLKPWGFTTQDYSLCLQPDQEVITSAEAKMAELQAVKGQYYVMCPLGSYARKNLPLPVAAQIIHALTDQGKQVFLIGGPKEQAQLLELAKVGRLPLHHVLAGTFNLPELAVFLQQAKALVSVDTGPMHMAQAVNCPTVAVFGPTDPAIWGPRNSNSQVFYRQVKCAPCWGKGICQDYQCMEQYSAKEILRALEQI